jgi:hypothetical protein
MVKQIVTRKNQLSLPMLKGKSNFFIYTRCCDCILPNAKLTHGSLAAAGGSKTGQGEGAEAAQAASVTEPVELWPHFYNNPPGEPLGAAYG